MQLLKRLRAEKNFDALFEEYLGSTSDPKIQQALKFMRDKHDNSDSPMRLEGVPYWTHPAEIYLSMEQWGSHDWWHYPTGQIVAILHDVVEDTGTSLEEIASLFGSEVANGVSILSYNTIVGHENLSREQLKKQYWERLGQAPQWLISIKALDRIHNLESTAALLTKDPKRFRKFARRQTEETLLMLVPLLIGAQAERMIAICCVLEKMLDFIENP